MGAVYLKNGAISGTENGGIVFYAQNWPSNGNLVIVGLLAWKIKFIALKHFCENELVFSQKCLSAIIPLIKYLFCQLAPQVGSKMRTPELMLLYHVHSNKI